jgi:hypothetical protein
MLEDFFFLKGFFFFEFVRIFIKTSLSLPILARNGESQDFIQEFFFYFSQKEKGQGENLENKKRENKRRIMLNWVWAGGDDSTR